MAFIFIVLKLFIIALATVVLEDTFEVVPVIVPAVKEDALTLPAVTPGTSVRVYPVHSNVSSCVVPS